MAPQPLYEPGAVTPCYKLRYGWTGWPTVGTRFPDTMESLLAAPSADWEADVHFCLRGNIEHSPEQIALAFQNNLAYTLGQVCVWQATYYVGTSGEYDMNAVRSWE